VSKDIGRFRFELIRDSGGKIKGVKIIIGFSYIPFIRKWGLFSGRLKGIKAACGVPGDENPFSHTETRRRKG
jgi:hypothetical protein